MLNRSVIFYLRDCVRVVRRDLQQELLAFSGDEKGGVAILLAVTLLMLMICSGVAIDFARGQSTKDVLQQDLDAALLFAGNERRRRLRHRDLRRHMGEILSRQSVKIRLSAGLYVVIGTLTHPLVASE